MKARVYVLPKTGVLDPQGKAIAGALGRLGFEGVSDVRAGKVIDLELHDTDAATARDRVKVMCEQLLANTVIENYVIEIVG
jgi:phosphoribosylformylglycinamidine synthase subunit PurS